MTTLSKVSAVLALLAVCNFAPASAWSFSCQSGRPGSNATCSCSGRTDCQDMRRSEMCGGDLTCKEGKCTCTAALVADPGPSTGPGGVRPKFTAPKGATGNTLQKAP